MPIKVANNLPAIKILEEDNNLEYFCNAGRQSNYSGY